MEWIEINNTPYTYIVVCFNCKYPKIRKNQTVCVKCNEKVTQSNKNADTANVEMVKSVH